MQDIKNTWQKQTLKGCLYDNKNQIKSKLFCKRKRVGYEFIDVEYFNEKPLIIKISKFANLNYLHQIESYYNKSKYIKLNKKFLNLIIQ